MKIHPLTLIMSNNFEHENLCLDIPEHCYY